MYLQGAEWNQETKMLVEPTSPNLFQQFPTLLVSTQLKDETEEESA
jgi:hypothetical protein